MARAPVSDDSVGRMQFLLTMRRRGIGDAEVLRALDEVPREHFVGPEFHDAAYADQALPIACGQTISQPYVVAYMTEQLAVEPKHRVLEIGTGSGYQAAILSRLAREVVSDRALPHAGGGGARAGLPPSVTRTLTFGSATASPARPTVRPFDRIIVTAAAETVPDALVEQLAEDGVMLLPLGPHDGVQRLVKLTKTADGLKREELLGVRFVPLLPGQAREL